MRKIRSPFLKYLRKATELTVFLDYVIETISKEIPASVCAIYYADTHKRCYSLLSGTFAVSSFKMRCIPFHQSFIGSVGQQVRPLNLIVADSKTSIPKNGADFFPFSCQAFLGVPITHQRQLLGVIALAREESKAFTNSDQDFLVTIAAFLGKKLAESKKEELTALLQFSNASDDQNEIYIFGAPCSEGIGIGRAALLFREDDLSSVIFSQIEAHQVVTEVKRFKKALLATKQEFRTLRKLLKDRITKEELALFNAYLHLLDSKSWAQEVLQEIQKGEWAPGALRRVIQFHVDKFAAMENSYLQERSSDIQGLGMRVLHHLMYQRQEKIPASKNTILFGEDISAADLASIHLKRLKGMVSKRGSANSHVAILARALGIPAVMGVQDVPLKNLSGKKVIVDGYRGQIIVNPTDKTIRCFRKKLKKFDALQKEFDSLKRRQAKTANRKRVLLYVNAGLSAEIRPVKESKLVVDGVGLFRTEVCFMKESKFPSETEQCELYKKILKQFTPRPVMMRTLDLGGDKMLPYFNFCREENPFLGWRGIRLTLDNPDIFFTQIRAMLRASLGSDNLWLLFPMVTDVQELEMGIAFVHQAYQELRKTHKKLKMPKIGAMVEVPAAVYQAQALAERADFLSVGSNDLAQYLLAVDRGNAHVASLFQTFHPAVLEAMLAVVKAGHDHNKHVSICGEMASDPIAAILLVGMGFDSLSMQANSVLKIKSVLRFFTQHAARKLAKEVLQMETSHSIRSYLYRKMLAAGAPAHLLNLEFDL